MLVFNVEAVFRFHCKLNQLYRIIGFGKNNPRKNKNDGLIKEGEKAPEQQVTRNQIHPLPKCRQECNLLNKTLFN